MVSKSEAIAELRRRRSGGVTREQAVAELEKRRGASAQAPEPQEGIARTALEQGLQGATFGFADEAANVIGAGIASAVTGEEFSSLLAEAKKGTTARQKRQIEQNPVTAIGAQVAGAVATGVAGAGTKAGQLVTNLITRGAIPTRVAASVATGATAGAVTGAGTAEEGQRLAGAAEGAAFGAATGAALPAVAGAAKAAGRVIVPEVAEATKKLANRAREFGIPLRLDQISPSRARRTVQKLGQEIPFSGDVPFEEAQRKAFTKAVARTIGQETEDLGPETVNRFLTDTGKKFDDVLKGEKINVTDDIATKLDGIVEEAQGSLGLDSAPISTTSKQIKAALGIKVQQKNQLLKEITQSEDSVRVLGQEVEAARSSAIAINNEISDLNKLTAGGLGLKNKPLDKRIAEKAQELKNAEKDILKIQTKLDREIIKNSRNTELLSDLQKPFTVNAGKIADIRSRLIKRATTAQGGAKLFIGEIIEVLDDEIGKSISPEKFSILQQARREWRNFKTIQPLLEKATDGQINPTQLLNRVASSKFISASAKETGEDELVDLARIGKEFLPKAGGSDTVQKGALGALATGVLGVAKAGAIVGGARVVQSLNRSQRLVDKALKATVKKAPSKAPLTGLIASQAALQ